MPSYAYTVLDANGARMRGVCRSTNRSEAATTLRASRLFILDLQEVREPAAGAGPPARARGGLAFLRRLCRPVTNQDLIQFFRQMGLMLRSGLPLAHALEVFRGQCPKPRLAEAAGRIGERLQGGTSFSAALEREPRLFSPLAVRMAATGEATGELDVILERVAVHMERRADLRNSLLTSMTYPALVLLITVAVVAFLVTSVVPKFTHMLSSRGLALPASTQLLVDITDFLNRNGIAILASLLGAALVVLALSATRRGRYGIDWTLLAAPGVGHVLTMAFMTHFGRTLAILLRSGVSILDGLRLLRESVPNRLFAAHLQRAEQAVLEGRSLSKGLQARLIPALLPELVGVGEATGTLDSVLEDVGDFFERKLQREIKWMTTFFEPALVLIIGTIVGFVYISFFSVLYQVTGR